MICTFLAQSNLKNLQNLPNPIRANKTRKRNFCQEFTEEIKGRKMSIFKFSIKSKSNRIARRWKSERWNDQIFAQVKGFRYFLTPLKSCLAAHHAGLLLRCKTRKGQLLRLEFEFFFVWPKMQWEINSFFRRRRLPSSRIAVDVGKVQTFKVCRQKSNFPARWNHHSTLDFECAKSVDIWV